MSNGKRRKARDISRAGRLVKFMSAKCTKHIKTCTGLCHELAMTTKLNTHDLRKNVMNMLRDGMIRAEVVHLYKISVSVVKYSLKQSREQGKVVFKLILGPSSVKKPTLSPGTLNCNRPRRAQRRAR